MAKKEKEVTKDQRTFEARVIEILERLDRHDVGTDVLISSLKADYVSTVYASAESSETEKETTA